MQSQSQSLQAMGIYKGYLYKGYIYIKGNTFTPYLTWVTIISKDMYKDRGKRSLPLPLPAPLCTKVKGGVKGDPYPYPVPRTPYPYPEKGESTLCVH